MKCSLLSLSFSLPVPVLRNIHGSTYSSREILYIYKQIYVLPQMVAIYNVLYFFHLSIYSGSFCISTHRTTSFQRLHLNDFKLYHNLFNQSPGDGHLGCFTILLLQIMLMNNLVQMFYLTYTSMSVR